MANNSRERIFKVTLVALIVGLGIILFRQARPFFGGILSAFTLYILLRRPTFRLAERLRRPTLATVIMVLAVIIFIAVPLTLIIWFIVSQIQQAEWNVGEIIAPAQQMFDIIEKRFGIDIVSQQTISFVAGKLTALGQSVLGGIGNFFVNLLVAVLLLFFLLNGGRKMEQYLASIIPMKNINKRETMEKVNKMVKSNAIGIPMVATLQGIIAFIGYMIFDVPNAGLAAIATGFCSIVPIVGTMVVWVPLGIYFMVLGQWGQAIGLLVFSAIFISQSDNLLRFILQKKMADTHPLITIFGVFLGLSLFGFIGIIFGPLLVSLFLLFVSLGITQGFTTVVLAHITFCTPYVVLSVLPRLKQMNPNLYEAALDLGATPMQALWKVIIPEIRPGMISGFILALTISIDDFAVTVFTIGNQGLETLSTYIYADARKGGLTPELRPLSAIIFIVILVTLIVLNLRTDKKKQLQSQKTK